MRDYGTGEWAGGNPDCDHRVREDARIESSTLGGGKATTGHQREGFKDECPRCGARRVDQQLGLEPTPDQYVARMVEVFREVRRVLARHGTCWVNLGDSYNANQGAGFNGQKRQDHANRHTVMPRTGFKPKDLVGIPWRVAFALQTDGWYLRSDIIWSKPNPMPESVTDRPTKAHEYVFLLTKQPRYWFDQEAVRERYQDSREGGDGFRWNSERYTNQTPAQSNHTPTGRGPDGRKITTVQGADGSIQHRDGERWPHPAGRNIRSVWEIATQPYPEAHFATFPEELARRCILAGCPERVCRVCGKPSERITSTEYEEAGRNNNSLKTKGGGDAAAAMSARPYGTRMLKHTQTLGWSDCGHHDYRPGVVLDPFLGSGTTALVARNHGRHAIGIELSAEYAELAARRTRQLSLLAT